MARPRVPKAKAKATGQDVQHAPRFEPRKEPKVTDTVGDPPGPFKEWAIKAWNQFKDEIPWLNKSHRAVLEIACGVRSRMMAGEDVGIQALNLLRQCLGQMGATPADASKVTIPDGEEDKDPADKYLK